MPTLSQFLLAASAGILLVLGTAHLYLTFFTTSFHPRDASVRERMDATQPKLTRETTVWKAWIGFNASHSIGVMVFGLLYGYLALWHGPMLMASAFLLGLGGLVLLSYCVLARRYWFRIPLVGCGLATVLYIAGVVVGVT